VLSTIGCIGVAMQNPYALVRSKQAWPGFSALASWLAPCARKLHAANSTHAPAKIPRIVIHHTARPRRAKKDYFWIPTSAAWNVIAGRAIDVR
jgi:hypothetical protein